MKLASETFRFHIDQPTSWEKVHPCLVIKGWCFSTDGQPIHGLRLRVGGLLFTGVTGQPRPDVKDAFSKAPSNAGFTLRGALPATRNHIEIEALTANKNWKTVVALNVHAHKRRLPLWIPGSAWTELMYFQTSTQIKHPPRPIDFDRLPQPTLPRFERPQLSIVTPSFQQASFLPTTVESVLGQTDVDCDYIVQDGGSRDGSQEILRRFAAMKPASGSPRLLAWASEPDHGQADAIKRGFLRTQGRPDDLMAWINSDDFYAPGTLAYVTDFFKRHPEVDVIYGHRILVDEDGREIGRWFLPRHDNSVLQLNDFVPQETMFWRRRIWDRVEGVDPSFKFALDWDLLLRFQATGAKIVRVPYFLACFRVHAAQKTLAQMEILGEQEISALRLRTFGRQITESELQTHPSLLQYLRRSAWIEFLWRRLKIRAR